MRNLIMPNKSLKHLFISAIILLLPTIIAAKTVEKHSFTVTKDIVWAEPDGIELKMDIYVPNGGQAIYPVMIIYHGGGWLINQKEIMDSLSIYLVSHANYVICNVDYRLLGDNNNTTTIKDCIEDALGAAVWIKENISAYQGDSTKIGVTGDSAGGYLASMVALCGTTFRSITVDNDTMNFKPSWLPANKTAKSYALHGGVAIKAAILSYPVVDFHKRCATGFETVANPFWAMAKVKHRGVFGDTITLKDNPAYYKSVSPMHIIPQKTIRALPPQLCIVGSLDVVTPPASIKKYRDQCRDAEQPITYWKYGGKPHAFLDAKKNTALNINFTRDAPKAIDKMIQFLDGVFY